MLDEWECMYTQSYVMRQLLFMTTWIIIKNKQTKVTLILGYEATANFKLKNKIKNHMNVIYLISKVEQIDMKNLCLSPNCSS